MLPSKAPPLLTRSLTHHDTRGHRRTQAAVDTRFLIIDGDRQIGRALSFMLEARGYGEVRAVRSAARAEAIFAVFQPDVVFMELELPDTGNLQLAAQLRRISRLRNFRLVALSRDLEQPLREEIRAAGVECYLVKPVVQDELDKILCIPATRS